MTVWVVSSNFTFPLSFEDVREAEEWAEDNMGVIVPESQIDPLYIELEKNRL